MGRDAPRAPLTPPRSRRGALRIAATLLLVYLALVAASLVRGRGGGGAGGPAAGPRLTGRRGAEPDFEALAERLRAGRLDDVEGGALPPTPMPPRRPLPTTALTQHVESPPVPPLASAAPTEPVTTGPTASSTAPPPFKGVDLGGGDNHVRVHPGGTEAEALAARRRLSDANRGARSFRDTHWRADGAPLPLPHGLAASQAELPATIELPFESALRRCGFDFACLIDAVPDSSPAVCRRTYGAELIHRLRAGATTMCEGASVVECRMAKAHDSHDIHTAACRATDVAVDFSKIADGDYPWLRFEAGALAAACTKTTAGHRAWRFMHCQADWMDLGFSEASAQPTPSCAHRYPGPVYFQTRSGDYSPFAMAHDWVNTIISHAAFGLDARHIRTVIMDRMTAGFFLPVWELAFSQGAPLLWYTDLRDEFRNRVVCFDEAYFNIPARLSPLYNHDDCEGSAILDVFRDFTLHALGALRTVAPPEKLTVTIIVRRNYNTGHHIGRRFGNLKELTVALRATSNDIVVNQVDFADMDFDHQLNVSRASDVLVAIHGAGLIHLMFQHDFGGVFEFFCPEKPSSNYRYQQLSKRMRRRYDSMMIENSDNVVDMPAALPRLQALISAVREAKRRFFHLVR